MKTDQSEHQLQREIVKTLTLAGFLVRDTTAYMQTGRSAITKGIPDLLAGHPLVKGIYWGLEVKRPGKAKLSAEQKLAHDAGEYAVVQSIAQALGVSLSMIRRFSKLSTSEREDAEFKFAINRAVSILVQLGGEV